MFGKEMSVLGAGHRYGENPHQPAAFYTDASLREYNAGGVATSIVHWGKEMSYNNYLVSWTDRGSCIQTAFCAVFC